MKKLNKKRNKKLMYFASLMIGLIFAICYFTNPEATLQFIFGGGYTLATVVVLRDLTSIGSYGNTGSQTYSFNPELIKGAILVPKAWYANTAYLDTMIASLQADTVKAPGSRIYPIWRFGGMEDKSVAEKTLTLGYGDMVNGPEGVYSFRFEVLGGGFDLQKELKKFNGEGFKVLLVDSNDVIMGTSTATADQMAGFTSNVRAIMPKYSTGADNTKYFLDITLQNTREVFENLVVYKSSVSVEQNVVGCLNVAITEFKSAIATAVYIKATTDQGLIDLYDTYGGTSGKMTASGAWVVKNAAGAAVVVTVTYDDTDKFWILTFSTLTGQTITVSMETPANLRTALVGVAPGNGYESNILSITLP